MTSCIRDKQQNNKRLGKQLYRPWDIGWQASSYPYSSSQKREKRVTYEIVHQNFSIFFRFIILYMHYIYIFIHQNGSIERK